MAHSLNTTFVVEESTIKDSIFSKDSLTTGDSTRSLLTPLYASDYDSGSRSSSSSSSSSLSSRSDSDSSDGSSSTSYAKFDRRKTTKSKRRIQKLLAQASGKGKLKNTEYKLSPDEIYRNKQILTKSWEEWVIEKAVNDLKKLQFKKEMRRRKKLEEQQRKEEKRKRQEKESENREKWLNEKNYELEKKRREEAAQKEYERLKEKQKRELIENKSRDAYEKWVSRKKEVMKQQKLNESQRKIELREKEFERRKCSEEAYKEWLQKTKPRKKMKCGKKTPAPNTEDFYKRITGPSPSYVNPVPWTGVLDESKSRSLSGGRREKIAFQSPPLLWRDYEERLGQALIKEATSCRTKARP